MIRILYSVFTYYFETLNVIVVDVAVKAPSPAILSQMTLKRHINSLGYCVKIAQSYLGFLSKNICYFP